MEEEVGNPFRSDGFLGRAKNYPLSKAMANHDQKGIEAHGKGKICDKVARDLLEGTSERGANGSEGRNGGVCVRFVLLENCTSFNVFAYKRC